MTITELLVTTVLMGFTMAAVGEMVVLNTFASTKLSNSVDGQLGSSRALRRIAEDVRRSRVIGTIDGTNSITINGITYNLNSQTLILQQPTLFQDSNESQTSPGPHSNLDGFPVIPAATSNPLFDTVIYQIVDDPANAGTSLLQVTRAPAIPAQPISSSTKSLPVLNSQVVLTGIIGPGDPNNGINPAPFSWLPASTGTPLGVSINLEVQTPPGGTGKNVQRVATHLETYLKSSINSRPLN